MSPEARFEALERALREQSKLLGRVAEACIQLLERTEAIENASTLRSYEPPERCLPN